MNNTDDRENVQHDTLFSGRLVCSQHKSGYRFSIDAVLLAHFVKVRPAQKILDLGTGSGVVSLILLFLHKNLLQECSGVELQPGLAQLAENNIKINGYDDKNRIYQCDVKDIRDHISAGRYDIIVCNPPFFPESSGRKSKNEESLIARHQISATTDDFLTAASFAVRNKGDVYFIYPATLFAEFILSAKRHNLTAKTARFIYSYPETEKGARLVLIKCRKNGGSGLEIKSPLYIYKRKNGPYTAEVESFYSDPGGDAEG